ncbi:MAG: NAD-dependent epimerase/dehydratase family protein [Bacteroidota bacterium]
MPDSSDCISLSARWRRMKRPSAGTRIQIFGDSSTARDYTYVEDIFDGILKASNKCQGFEIFNLGESRTTSL